MNFYKNFNWSFILIINNKNFVLKSQYIKPGRDVQGVKLQNFHSNIDLNK